MAVRSTFGRLDFPMPMDWCYWHPMTSESFRRCNFLSSLEVFGGVWFFLVSNRAKNLKLRKLWWNSNCTALRFHAA